MEPTQEIDENEIIQVCTTDRGAWDRYFHSPNDDDVQVARALLQTPFRFPSISTFGRLNIFPPETLREILEYLDIASLFRFHCVNHSARQAVGSMRKLAILVEHTMSALYMVLRTGIGRYFTLEYLYTVLTLPNCLLCGKFGPFLYLCAVVRCCHRCIQGSIALRVFPFTAFVRAGRKCCPGKNKQLQQLVPVMSLVEGIHRDRFRPGEPKRLVSLTLAKQHFSELGTIVEEAYDEFAKAFLMDIPQSFAAIRFPWYNEETGILERGVVCKGSTIEMDNLTLRCQFNREDLFSRADFMKHFKSCKWCENGWKCHQQEKQLQEGKAAESME